jgi:hypothetical protein
MGTLISWVRNNAVSIVEIIDWILQLLQLIVNIATRLLPVGNKWVVRIHDGMKIIEAPTNAIKNFLLQRAG